MDYVLILHKARIELKETKRKRTEKKRDREGKGGGKS
jgi:hypothetical protein